LSINACVAARVSPATAFSALSTTAPRWSASSSGVWSDTTLSSAERALSVSLPTAAAPTSASAFSAVSARPLEPAAPRIASSTLPILMTASIAAGGIAHHYRRPFDGAQPDRA